MKKSLFIIVLLITSMAYAQNNDTIYHRNPNAKAIKESELYCPNLFNPQRFSVQGANPSLASWQGYAGGYNYGNTGKMGQHASSCGNWDMTFGKGPATGAQIDAARANLSTEPSSWIFYGNSGACGYNSTPQDLSHKRFRIMSAGMDPLTHGALSQVPPYDPDTIFSSSIRLGNHCGGGQQAEKLIYQFKVRPQNALLVLYYAISLEDARHDAAQNPEFVIEVQVGEPTVNTISTNLNTYRYETLGEKLFYGQPTPVQGQQLAPFLSGGSGTNGSNPNIYLPWNKVVINLGEYLNKPIRICIGTGDCSYSVHYSYSYIAGYCRPMKITVDGCPINNDTNQVVSTLYAPSGLEDSNYTADPRYHAYKWYRCKNPNVLGDTIGLVQGNNDAWFHQAFELITTDSFFLAHPDTVVNKFNTVINDFEIDEAMRDSFNIPDSITLLERRAFACEMTTYMNKSTDPYGVRKYPITSRLFADASNRKPHIKFDQIASCDGKVTLKNRSICGAADYITPDSISWKIYRDSTCRGTPIDTLIGANVFFQSEEADTLYAKIHVPTIDSTCYSEIKEPIHSIKKPKVKINVSNDEPCEGEEVILINRSLDATQIEWLFPDGTTSTEDTVYKAFEEEINEIRLSAKNGYSEVINGDTIQCSNDTTTQIKVFTSPNLIISDDTIVCKGQRSHVTVTVNDSNTTSNYKYEWYLHLNRDGEEALQTGAILEQIPEDGRPWTKYYVKVTRLPQECVAWDSVTLYMVDPKLEMIPNNGNICPGETVKIIGSDAHHYSWLSTPEDPSLIGQESNDTIIVTPTETTTYTLIGHGSDNCNADPISTRVTLFPTPIPSIQINPDFIDSENPQVTLSDQSQYGNSTLWDFGDGNTSDKRQITYTFNNIGGEDDVIIKMTTFNQLQRQAKSCYASTSINIPVRLFSVWIPNIFSPNETDNNLFRIYTTNILEYFSVRILNHYGQQLFYSTNQNFTWDGTYEGILCPQGSYVYIIKYHRPGDTDVTVRKGTITLIR